MSSFASFYSLRRNPVTGVIYLTIPSDEVVFGNGQTINEERIRIVGGMRLDTAAYLELADGSTVAVSGVNEGRVRYNAVTGLFECSENGGAYLPFGATGTGWVKTGTVVHLTVATDTVAIGSAAMVGTEKLYLAGDLRLRDGDSIIYQNGGNDISLIWGTGPNVVIGNAFATNLTSNVSTQHTWNLSGLQYCALNATNMVIGPSNASYTMVIGQDSTNTVAVKTATIRGTDNVGAGGKGTHLSLRPGQGNAAADGGWLYLNIAGGTAALVVVSSLSETRAHLPLRFVTNGDYTALAGDNITLGRDNNANIVVISTGTIRGADHTFANSNGVNLALRPGLGGAGGVNGWAHLCNAAGTPGTTQTGLYVVADGATTYIGAGGTWNFGLSAGSTAAYKAIRIRSATNGSLAIAAENLTFGGDDPAAVTIISTGTIRGGDHTFGTAKGVNITIRPGRGDAVTDDGALTLCDARAVDAIKIGPTALTMNLGPTTSSYTVICGVDSANTGSLKSTTIRGADNTAAAGYGQNIIIRPGSGGAGGVNGIAYFRDSNDVTRMYYDTSGMAITSTCTVSGYLNIRGYSILSVRGAVGDDVYLANTVETLLGGFTNNTGVLAASTMTIRGADHTFANSNGVNVVIRPGAGGAGGTNGIFTLQDAQANALLSNNADGLIFSRANTRVPYTSNANPYDVGADKAQIIYKAAGGTINLRAAPTTGAQLHIINATAGNITIGRNGKNINGAAADKTLGSYYHAFLLYDGTEWWYSSAPGA